MWYLKDCFYFCCMSLFVAWDVWVAWNVLNCISDVMVIQSNSCDTGALGKGKINTGFVVVHNEKSSWRSFSILLHGLLKINVEVWRVIYFISEPPRGHYTSLPPKTFNENLTLHGIRVSFLFNSLHILCSTFNSLLLTLFIDSHLILYFNEIDKISFKVNRLYSLLLLCLSAALCSLWIRRRYSI